jgi:hypothetical protein
LSVAAGDAVGDQSVFDEVSPSVGEAGKPFHVKIGARDAHGNPVAHGGLHILLFTSVEGGHGEPIAVKDEGNGTYTATHTLTKSGVYQLTAKVGDHNIKGSPLRYEIRAGEISADETELVGPDSITTGETTFFVIKLKDKYGNPVHTIADVVGALVSPSGEPIHASVTAKESGVYHLDFKPTKAAPFKLEAKVNGHPVKGTPKAVVVKPARPSADNVKVAFKDNDGFAAGKPVEFVVQFLDPYGNIAAPGEAAVKVVLKPVSVPTPITLGSTSATRPRSSSGGNLGRQPSGRSLWNAAANAVQSRSFTNLKSASEALPEPITPTLTHAEDGSINGSVVPKIVGKYLLDITLDDVPVKSEPFEVVVVPSSVKPANCILEGPGLQGAPAGDPIELIVVERDEFGNRLTVPAPVSINASVSGDNIGPIAPKLTPNPDGTFSLVFTGNKVGHYKVDVTIDNTSILGCPYIIVVDAGTVSPADCTASGDGLHTTNVGEASFFEVQTKDKGGNRSLKGGSAVVSFLQGPEKVDVNVTDNNDGTYSAKYIVNQVGEYKLHVVVDGKPISASPFEVTSKSGKPHPEGTQVEGKFELHAGKPQSFVIRLRDKAGNPVKSGEGIKVEAGLVPLDKLTAQALHGLAAAVPSSAETTGKGKKTRKPKVKKEKKPKTGDESSSSSSSSSESGSDSDTESKGKKSKEKKHVEHVEQEDEPIKVEVHDNGDGTYTITVPAVKKSGRYAFNIDLDGAPLKGSPFHVAVQAGPPKQVTLSGITLNELGHIPAVAGNNAQFVLHASDEFGNAIKSGGADVEFKVDGPTKLALKVLDNDDGSYTVAQRFTVAGKYDAHVTIGGHDVASALNIDVQPNELSPAHAIAIGAGIKKAKAGEEAKFLVQSVDKYGNEIQHGGAEVIAHIKGPDGAEDQEHVYAIVVDNENGIYNVAYTVNNIGRYILHVTIAGVNIASSPFTVRVTPGAAVASKSVVKNLSDLPYGRAKSDSPAFKIHLHDRNGHKKSKGGEELEVYLRKPIRKPATIIDNGDGSYDIRYPKGLEVGEYEVIAELRGERFEIPNTSVQVEEPGSLPEEEQQLLEELLPTSSSALTNFLRSLDDEKKAAFVADLRGLKR